MIKTEIKLSYQESTNATKYIQVSMGKKIKQALLIPFIVSAIFAIISLIITGSTVIAGLIMGIIFVIFGSIIFVASYVTFSEIRILKMIQQTMLILLNTYDKILEFEKIMNNLELIIIGVREILASLHGFYQDKSGKIDKKNQIVASYGIILNFLYQCLLDLRSDLATRLTEQQQILEGAKSEVEQHITGTPELIAVSEAQKARLDRQIEQFEELRRVLVRM